MKFLVWLIVICGWLALSQSAFVECDLDLEDANILIRLPEECQNPDEATKALMLEEATSFKQFHQKLLNYEAAQNPGLDDEIPMDMDFRRHLYTEADLHECLNVNETLEQYVQCVIEKRRKMVDIIDSQVV